MRRHSLSTVLVALTLAACSDAVTAPSVGTPGISRYEMADSARSVAAAFVTQADSAEQAGDVYRPMLLRALVDALQFGSPIDTASIKLDGQNLLFNVTVMNARMERTDLSLVNQGFVLAWNGPNAERVFVTAVQPGIGTTQSVALYLNGGDTLLVGSTKTTKFVWADGLLACVYDNATALTGPAWYGCQEGTATAAMDLEFPVYSPPYSVSFPERTLAGVSVLRKEADILGSRALQGVMGLMQHEAR